MPVMADILMGKWSPVGGKHSNGPVHTAWQARSEVVDATAQEDAQACLLSMPDYRFSFMI